jgi:hypothetical protein
MTRKWIRPVPSSRVRASKTCSSCREADKHQVSRKHCYFILLFASCHHLCGGQLPPTFENRFCRQLLHHVRCKQLGVVLLTDIGSCHVAVVGRVITKHQRSISPFAPHSRGRHQRQNIDSNCQSLGNIPFRSIRAEVFHFVQDERTDQQTPTRRSSDVLDA